jgi:four helix bundle protein
MVSAYIIGKELLRWGTSVAANYRAVGRARSRADASSKLATVLEEADEFCLLCLADHDIVRADLLAEFIDEANASIRIFSASLTTPKKTSVEQKA